MKNIENKRMEHLITGDGAEWHITLDHLAVPESVKVSLLDEPIIPLSFDCCGHPNFTQEQAELIHFKEISLKRMLGKHTPLELEIIYEEDYFTESQDNFDSIKGIEKSLLNLSDLNNLLNKRKKFYISQKKTLNEYVIFGRFLLDKFGHAIPIDKTANNLLTLTGKVENFETFKKNNQEKFTLASSKNIIPQNSSICPCCGKKYTIDDILSNPVLNVRNKAYHEQCWKKYVRQKEISTITELMDNIYKPADFTYELLPNKYSNVLPWILFHTVDGDITIGRKKNKLFIEWHNNYKNFNMEIIAGTRKKKHYIYASCIEQACIYLKTVLTNVNPTYPQKY